MKLITNLRSVFSSVRIVPIVIFAIAASANVATAVDRSWNSSSSGDWSDASDWSPNGVPMSGDVVLIGNFFVAENDTVKLDQNDTAAEVHITDGMNLDTDGFSLFVGGDTFVSGSNSVGNTTFHSDLILDRGVEPDDYDTNNLTVTDGGRVRLDNGAILEVDELLTIGSNSSLRGEGVIRLGGVGVVYQNDGDLDPTTGGMTINVTGGGQLDLDGTSGNGSLLLTGGKIDGSAFDNLTINGGTLADPFGGEIGIISNGFLAMNLDAPWSVSSGGEINVFGGFSNPGPAIINGADVSIGGELSVTGFDAHGRIDANATFTSLSNVSINVGDRLEMNGNTTIEGGHFTLEEDGTLEFDGPTTIEGGTFNTFSSSAVDGNVEFNGPTTWAGEVNVNGYARQDGDAIVASASTVNADTFDMDGSAGTTEWDINARLVVNANRLDASNNFFDGTLNIGAGLPMGLEINITDASNPDWVMDGTLNLNGLVIGSPEKLAGSPVRVTGTLNAKNRVGISADTTFTNTSDIDFFANGSTVLLMSGKTTIAAGVTFTGGGELENSVGGLMTLEEGLVIGGIGLVNRGVLQTGNSVGAVAINRFENMAGATLFSDVGKNNNGTDSDMLAISTGPSELAGDLQPRVVQISGDNQPLAVGDSFTILTAVGGLNGTFDQVLDSLQGGNTFTWDVTYNPSNVEIELTSLITGLLGDYDYDGDVDGSDFLKWQSTFGSTANLMADGNLDGIVNAPDLTIWEDNYGAIAALVASVAVPEPGSAFLVLAGIVISGLYRSRTN